MQLLHFPCQKILFLVFQVEAEIDLSLLLTGEEIELSVCDL